MPSQVQSIIDQIKSKAITVDEGAVQLKDVIMGAAPERPEPGTPEFKDFTNQRLADKDDEGYDDSFQEVVAAWIGGDLSDGQYYTIREVVMEGLSAGGEGIEPPDGEDPENG